MGPNLHTSRGIYPGRGCEDVCNRRACDRVWCVGIRGLNLQNGNGRLITAPTDSNEHGCRGGYHPPEKPATNIAGFSFWWYHNLNGGMRYETERNNKSNFN